MTTAIETATCDQCHGQYRVGEPCYHCAKRKRDVLLGLKYAGLTPLPSAQPLAAWSPLAMLGHLEISHSHRGYWVVSGRVPLAIAKELYADPAGKDLIRVEGHCGCPPPEMPWVRWHMPDGRKVLPLKEKSDCEGYAEKAERQLAEIARKILDGSVFSDDPASIGASGFIEGYHIDGDLGLRVFVDIVRRNGMGAKP